MSLNPCYSNGIAPCQRESLFLLPITCPKPCNILVFFTWFSHVAFLEFLIYFHFKKRMLCLHLIAKIVWSQNHIICYKIHFLFLGYSFWDPLVGPVAFLIHHIFSVFRFFSALSSGLYLQFLQNMYFLLSLTSFFHYFSAYPSVFSSPGGWEESMYFQNCKYSDGIPD